MKKLFKTLISVFLVMIMSLNLSAAAFYSDGTTAKALKFNNGKLRIMHVTDMHLEDDNVDKTVWLIGAACDREKPDVVVITGDNVANRDDAAVTKGYIDKLMSVFETRGIPTAVTFGNHDSETGAMSREELMAYYNTFSCSISVDDGDLLSGCGTYNVPILSSDGKVKFNLWIFDSHDYDSEGHYAEVYEDQVNWYKTKSDLLTAANGGEKVNSLAFQHIIVPEIYEALKKTDHWQLFAFKHKYNENEYYMFDPDRENSGTLNETPCCGYYNYGQFDAMVEKGDVLGIFSGHDHTNTFSVKYKGINITNSLSTRYGDDMYSLQYGYRIIDVDESDTSKYTTRVVSWYDLFSADDLKRLKSTDEYGFDIAREVTYKGALEKFFLGFYRSFATLVTFHKVTY